MDKLKKWIQENSHKMDVDEPNLATWDDLKNNLSKQTESDPLKNYIAGKKNELEIETPGVQSWEKISNTIKAKETEPIHRFKKRLIYLSAACVITLISFGVVRYINKDKVDKNNVVAAKPSPKNDVHLPDTVKIEYLKVESTIPLLTNQSSKQTIKHKNPPVVSKPVKKQIRQSLPLEVLQIQKDYDELIAGQIAYTKSLAVYGESTAYFQEFMNDFKMLEEQEKELRKSIVQHGLQENSIDDLAMIYQQKLTVLKKLQNEINKTSNRNKNLTDTIPSYISL